MIANITLIAIYLVFLAIFIQDYRKHSRMLRLYQQELQYVSNCYLNQLDIVRHLKYKRSITMAKWCDAMKSYFNESGFLDNYINERIVFYERWQKRWSKIAENLAPTK